MKALNKQTGQLEKVYVKALDSMPVGTVVEFNGQASDIPSGWEEISGENKIRKVSLKTPTGAHIVDGYSTSTTDGYSCNEVNNLVQDVYSTDEQVIGKWINNKPLYRKTIYSTSLTGNLSLSNIEFLRYKNFIAKVGNFIFPESRYVNENDNCNFFLNQSSLSYDFSVGSTWQGQVSYVTFDIEYTKTTD